MNVFISGPMQSKPMLNFAEFDRVAAIIEELGHTPLSPADVSRKLVKWAHKDPDDIASYATFEDETYMEYDIALMRTADALVLLPGWTHSDGVRVELAYARFRKIPIYSSIEEFEYLQKINRAPNPEIVLFTHELRQAV